MGIQINGSTDRITAIDGTIDFVSNIGNIGLITASNYVLQDAITIGAGSTIIKTVNGKLGIGTATPNSAIQINHVSPKIILEDNDNGADISIHNVGGAAVISAGSDITFQTSDTSEKFRIASNGRIGINDASPAVTLHVQGSNGAVSPSSYSVLDVAIEDNAEAALGIIGNSYSSIYFGDAATVLNGGIVYDHSDNSLGFRGSGNSEAFRIHNSGQVQVTGGGSTPFKVTHTGGDCAQFHRGSKYLGINADWGGNTGNSVITASTNLVVHTNGTNERLRITSGGVVNIGANFTQTTYPFSVQKDLDNGGNLAYFANSDGTYSQSIALSFDSNKDVQWEGGSGSGGLIWKMGTRGYVWKVGSNERFRIASSGQIGLGGANYGSSGQVLTSQGSGSAVQWATPGLAYAQQWHLTSIGNCSANTDNVLPTDAGTWEKRSQATNHAGTVGSDMSYSSGVFTFPVTGIWRIDFYGYWGIGAGDSDHNLRSRIQTTINNSSYSTVQEQVQSIKSDATYTYQGWFQTFIFDVTSTSNCKVRFVLNPSGSNCYYKANTNPPMTGSLFMRLGDT